MMTCSEVLDGFSDFLDGLLPDEESRAFDIHVEGCEDCRKYRDVMLRSLELVRALDPPTPSATFNERLNARLYLEDELSLATGPLGSGVTTGTTVVMTLLFAAAAWAPTVADVGFARSERLGTAVAEAPAGSVGSMEATGLGTFSAGQITLYQAEELEEDLWSYPNAVFYAYSSLSKRRSGRARSAAIEAVGLQ